MGSCSNSSVLQKEDIECLRCQLSRLKRPGELYETGSDWMLLELGNGFVFKRLCSAPEGGHRTPEMQTEQAEKSRQWVRVETALFSSIRRTTPEMQTGQAEKRRRTL